MRLRAAPCQFLCLAIINRPIVLYLYNHTTSKDISLDYCSHYYIIYIKNQFIIKPQLEH